jgi:hypothetical protein
MRADVKEIFFPLPFRREMDVAICIRSISDLERLWVRDVLETSF